MILISPSKNLNIRSETINYKFSEPQFKKKIKVLSDSLRGLSISELRSLMPISDKLVELNIKRFENFDKPDNPKKPAVFLFTVGKWRTISLAYMVIWGLMTAIARPWSYFDPAFASETLNRWLPEALYRVPHFGLPLCLLLALRRRSNNV